MIRSIDRRRGENAVGNQVALEPVEARADDDADDDNRQAQLRIEVLAAVEVGAAAHRTAIDALAARSDSEMDSGMSRPHPPHLIAAGASAAFTGRPASH